MLFVISPAKTLDFESDFSMGELTKPVFLSEAVKINKSLRKKSRKALRELQGISPQLAQLNYERNQLWNPEHQVEVKQAAFAFKGDVYQGLKAEEWNIEDMNFANDNLRILSGLYGLLQPGDQIMPYRLEMGTRLKVGRRANLYAFWGDKLKKHFKENIDPDRLIVNLASNEYFKAIKEAGLPNPVLNIEFLDFKNGDYKVISFFAKKARGLMANYLIKNKILDKKKIKEFREEEYYFDDNRSNDDHYVFLRAEGVSNNT